MAPTVYRSLVPPVPVVRHSIFSYLFEHTYSYPSTLPAFIDAASGQTLTRGQLKQQALRLAWGLQHIALIPETSASGAKSITRSPLRRGDMVMFMSPNSLSWPIALFGCVAAGLKVTFAGCGSTARELSWQWLDSNPRAIFVARHIVPVVKQMFSLIGVSSEEAERRIWVMDTLSDFDSSRPVAASSVAENDLGDLLRGRAMMREEIFAGDDADETVYICYSSGTTGRPKGVETTHKNVCSVLGMTNALWKGCESDHDIYLAVLPVYHMFGLAMILHYPFMRGRPVVMMNQGFEPEAFCRVVQGYRVTTVMLVPPILLTLSTHPAIDQYDLTSMTNIASGAAPLSVALAGKFLDRLAARGANVVLLQGCGSTETTCPAQIVAPRDSVKKFGSVGQLLPNIEARIMIEIPGSPDLFRDADEGQEGEMWLKGPTIAKGYFNNPVANASTYTSDGWFKTGDILRRDEDGYYYIVDRKKEMIKYKGHQIAPAELEAILMENPEVRDAGVIGVMNEYTGDELPRAYVTPSNPEVLKQLRFKVDFEKRVQNWFEGQVSYFKYLRGGVVAIPEVPKSPTGKILRKDLRERAKVEAKRQERAVLLSRL